MSNKKQILHVLKILTFVGALLLAAPQARAEGAGKGSGKGSAAAAAAAVSQGGMKSEENKSDKVDIKDLENQYWAAKDTDFSVVQNRAYTKEKRFALSAAYGLALNDSYNEGNIYQVSANYFWKERYGIQVDYQFADLKDGKLTGDLKSVGGGAAPDYNRMKSAYLVGFSYVPVYAKMSLLNKRIIYFDFAITPLIGMTTYQQQTYTLPAVTKEAFTYGFDISQYFFFSNHFAVRTSIRNQWYKQNVVKYSGTGQGTTVRDDDTSSFQFLMGLTFFF